jgi:hypothetical protein
MGNCNSDYSQQIRRQTMWTIANTSVENLACMLFNILHLITCSANIIAHFSVLQKKSKILRDLFLLLSLTHK